MKMSDISNLIVDFENVEDASEKYRRETAQEYLDDPAMTDKDLAGLFENIPISMNSYQNMTDITANYPHNYLPDDVYLALGLAGEAGECVEHIKKKYRNDNGVMTEERKQKLIKELGDIYYYLAGLAKSIGVSLEEVANTNQLKLLKRLKEKTIRGSGDDR
jgi:NTP pyrophosphatase (non-canonical NTP hydrolase)